MATEVKTSVSKHARPSYAWIALIFSTVAILSVAGWYYLTYSQGLNDDFVLSVKELSGPKKATSAVAISAPIDLVASTSEVDKELDTVSDSDFEDVQLDNTILGIQ